MNPFSTLLEAESFPFSWGFGIDNRGGEDSTERRKQILQESTDSKGLSMDKDWTLGECFSESRGRGA